MGFAETYRSEVLQSRLDRSRRAFFWARIVGIALLVTSGAALRSEPELARQLMLAAMDGIRPVSAPASASIPDQNGHLPVSRVKINRPAADTAVPDAQALADDAAQRLNGLRR